MVENFSMKDNHVTNLDFSFHKIGAFVFDGWRHQVFSKLWFYQYFSNKFFNEETYFVCKIHKVNILTKSMKFLLCWNVSGIETTF